MSKTKNYSYKEPVGTFLFFAGLLLMVNGFWYGWVRIWIGFALTSLGAYIMKDTPFFQKYFWYFPL